MASAFEDDLSELLVDSPLGDLGDKEEDWAVVVAVPTPKAGTGRPLLVGMDETSVNLS